MSLAVEPVVYSPELFDALIAEAAAGDGGFLERLRDEWQAGAMRFDGPGEILLAAFVGGKLVGVGGISHDPYSPQPRLGRVRHLYVLKQHRRRGVARSLMDRLIGHAREHFLVLRLSTQAAEAAKLYESYGFLTSSDFKETHRLELRTLGALER